MIKWNSVLTNTVSALVTAIVIGAMAIVWNGTTTVSEKINLAVTKVNENQLSQQAMIEVMGDTVKRLEEEIASLKHTAGNSSSKPSSSSSSTPVTRTPSTRPSLQQEVFDRRAILQEQQIQRTR